MEDIKIGDLVLTWAYDHYEGGVVDQYSVLISRTRKKDPWRVTLWINQSSYTEHANSLHPNSLRAALCRAKGHMQRDIKAYERVDSILRFLDPNPPRTSIWDIIGLSPPE